MNSSGELRDPGNGGNGGNGDDRKMRRLKMLGHVSYLLHGIVTAGAVLPGLEPLVVLLVLAFLLDILLRDEAAGTWQESHFRWRIRSVLWAAGLYALTAPLYALLYVPGKLAWWLISLWFFYRVLRGWLNLDANRPMLPRPPRS